jgi:thioredoxin 1
MTASHNVLHLDETNFDREVLESKGAVLVDFWAPWCGPCRAVGPSIDQIADEFVGRAKVAKVNVDDAPAVAARFGVVSIPTIAYFLDGRLVDSVTGAVPKSVIEQGLTKLVPTA